MTISAPLPDLGPLSAAKHLETLTLIESGASYPPPKIDLEPLAALTTLRELTLDRLSPRDLSPLGRMTGLEKLVIDRDQCADCARCVDCKDGADLGALEGLHHLRELTLDGTPIDDLSPLSTLPKLQLLQLGAGYSHYEWCSEEADPCTMPDRPSQRLPRLPNLEIRHLHDHQAAGICDITPEACPDACEALPSRRRSLSPDAQPAE